MVYPYFGVQNTGAIHIGHCPFSVVPIDITATYYMDVIPDLKYRVAIGVDVLVVAHFIVGF
jgi:hypothetical protein